MENNNNNNLFLLLKFAQAIQQKIKIETNEDAKQSLEKDLILIKDEIGKRVLNLPNDTQIFPPFDSSQFIDEKVSGIKEESSSNNMNEYHPQKSLISASPINSPSRYNKTSKIQSLSEMIDENNYDSNSYLDEYQSDENSICSFPGQPNSLNEFSANDIAAKFSQFIKQKEAKKTKESRIPKPKSKIPVPKQK